MGRETPRRPPLPKAPVGKENGSIDPLSKGGGNTGAPNPSDQLDVKTGGAMQSPTKTSR